MTRICLFYARAKSTGVQTWRCRASRQLSRRIRKKEETVKSAALVHAARSGATGGADTGGLVRFLRGENAIAGVAEAGEDVALLVDPLVDVAHVNVDARVLRFNRPDAFGGGEQAHERHVGAAPLLDCCQCCHSGAARGEHGVEHERLGARDLLGELVVVGDGREGLGVAVHAEVPHLQRHAAG